MLLPKFKNLCCTTTCDFMCSDCALWEETQGKSESIPELVIQCADSFFVNICGGNPVLFRELPHLIQQLQKRGHFITLTTNGAQLDTLDKRLFQFIHLPIIYFPAANEDKHRAISGVNKLKQSLDALAYLNELKKPHILHYPVNIENLEELPYIYDLIAKYKKTFLFISYSHTQRLSKQSQAYIRYYGSRKKVFTYFYHTAPATETCVGSLPDLEIVSLRSLLLYCRAFYRIYL